jgi:hypothetical protein
MSFKGRVKDTLVWWLSSRKPFILDDEYEIRLLYLDHKNHSAKLEITNLRTKVTTVVNRSEEDAANS